MPDEQDSMVCMRVANCDPENVVHGSIVMDCWTCRAPIWVSPSSVKLITTRPLSLVCDVCAIELIVSDPNPTVVPLTEEQRGEIRTHYGIRLKGEKE